MGTVTSNISRSISYKNFYGLLIIIVCVRQHNRQFPAWFHISAIRVAYLSTVAPSYNTFMNIVCETLSHLCFAGLFVVVIDINICFYCTILLWKFLYFLSVYTNKRTNERTTTLSLRHHEFIFGKVEYFWSFWPHLQLWKTYFKHVFTSL